MSPDAMHFEEILKRHGKLVYSCQGDSMLPLIREGKDLVVITPAQNRLKRFDVPLYRRASGQYVLHRVLKVREQDYVTCGDNRLKRELGVTDNQVLGVLTEIIRDGKTISVHSLRYRLYVFLWCRCFPIRAVVLRLSALWKRWRKRCKG